MASKRRFLDTLVLCVLLGISSLAIATESADPVVGIWRLNTARSTSSAPMFKSETRTYVRVHDGIALILQRVSAEGKTSTVETTFKYDGKDYPVTGSRDFDTISAKRIDANSIESTQKHVGKEVGTALRTLSADGKTLTLHNMFTNADGQQIGTLMVYERQ